MNPDLEKNIFEYVIELLKSLDPMIQILLVIFLTPLFFIVYKLVMNKGFRDDFFNLLSGFKRDTVYKIKNHEIFLIKSIYSNYISNINFNNTIKNNVFRIILNTKVEKTYIYLKEFLKLDIKREDNIDILMLKQVDLIINAYEKEIRDKLNERYKEDAEELYKIIYLDNFKKYHYGNVDYILKFIQMFSNSRLSNNQKVYIFFNLINIALDQAIVYCERTFDDLNSDLDSYNEKWHK